MLEDPGQRLRRALGIAAIFTLARMPLAAHLELSPDEAYYWLWSKRLAWSYFDHPPMVAWMIAGSTHLFGDGELAVRVPALLCGFVVAAALAGCAAVLAPPERAARAATATALLACALPLSHAGSLVVSPDAPAAAFWALALLALAAAFRGRRAGWPLAGVALGLALLSKYTAVLLGGSMALLALMDPATRRTLRTIPPWIAAMLAIALFTPVLVWNASHAWVSFLFQIHHGTGGHGGWHSGVEFFGAQLALLTPTLAVLVFLELRRGGSAVDAQAHRLLAAAFLPTFAVFSLLAFKSRPEANWAVFAYLSCAPLGGLAFARATADGGDRRTLGLYRATIALGVLATVLVSIHAVHPLVTLEKDRLRSEFHGWRARGAAARAIAGSDAVLLGDSYRVAAELGYYAGNPDRVGVARLPVERVSMFDVWDGPRLREGADALYVSWYDRTVPPAWSRAFGDAIPLPVPAGVTGTFVRLVSLKNRPPTEPGSATQATP